MMHTIYAAPLPAHCISHPLQAGVVRMRPSSIRGLVHTLNQALIFAAMNDPHEIFLALMAPTGHGDAAPGVWRTNNELPSSISALFEVYLFS